MAEAAEEVLVAGARQGARQRQLDTSLLRYTYYGFTYYGDASLLRYVHCMYTVRARHVKGVCIACVPVQR